MKDQVLKLCRRLKRCTLEDIVQFTELESEEVQTILYYLLDNNEIIENNGIYSISDEKPVRNDKNINLMIPYHSEADVEIILKSFCLEISSYKVAHLVKCQDKCVCDFYQIFRQKLYERQHNILLNNYFKYPQIARIGTFFEKQAFFYYYKNNVFISEMPLRANFEKEFTKPEVREYKKVYSFLKRVESHNINEFYVHQRLAEGIWRRNKTFEELYSDLKSLLFS